VIEYTRGELDGAPFALRASAAFAGLAPELAAGMARRLGSARISREMNAGQRAKR
jgi:hypothetical protein